MIMNNWKEFAENNIIQKEVRVKIAAFTPMKSSSEIEKEINTCLANEQADEVVTRIEGDHIAVQYTRYQQYESTDNGYAPTGIFHTKDMYDAFRAQGLFAHTKDIYDAVRELERLTHN